MKNVSIKCQAESYSGTIDPKNFTRIHWRKLPEHPGKTKYRMAATGMVNNNKVVFVGGSENPYNYSGIGYDGVPSQPDNMSFAWNTITDKWEEFSPLKSATMDHRGLLDVENKLLIVGGNAN